MLKKKLLNNFENSLKKILKNLSDYIINRLNFLQRFLSKFVYFMYKLILSIYYLYFWTNLAFSETKMKHVHFNQPGDPSVLSIQESDIPVLFSTVILSHQFLFSRNPKKMKFFSESKLQLSTEPILCK